MAATLDTPLARLLHARGLVALEPLRQALQEARADRPDGATLAQRLVARGLLSPGAAEAALRDVGEQAPTLRAERPPTDPGGAWAQGSIVGEYRVVRRLGSGGMGTVFEAEQVATGARRALKTLHAGGDPELRLRFQREAELLARVDGHPNVVRVHAAFAAHGCQVLVMDLVPGGDLLARLEDGPLGPAQLVELALALASGLSHLHRRGVLHRDLKPHNVMFDEHGTPLLVDFGLASAAGMTLTATGELLGTPAYMAPEQASGDRAAMGPTLDVYGLAALLFHAATGQPPYTGKSVLELLAQVCTAPPPSVATHVKGFPPALDEALRRGLAKQPADRPPDVLAFAASLVTALTPPRRPEPRPRGPLLAGLTVIAAVAAGLLVVLSATRPAEPPVAASPPPAKTAPPPPPPPPPPSSPTLLALPAPGPPWSLGWSLARDAEPERAPAALWLDADRAGPLEAIERGLPGALTSAFEGAAQARPEKRVLVAYGPSALRWRSIEESVWSLRGPERAGLQVTRTERRTTAVAANDRGALLLHVGAARWDAPRLEAWLQTRADDVDEVTLGLGDDDVGEWRHGLRLRGRERLVQGGGVTVRRWPGAAGGLRLALEPGAAPGARLRVDGKADPFFAPLDEALTRRPPPGGVTLMALETALAVEEVVVEGRPLATDVAARALPPIDAGPLVRVCAGFQVEGRSTPPGVEGGPFVALGEGADELRLELRGWRVVLGLGGLPIASVAVLDTSRPAPRIEGWLALERTADALHASGRIGDRDLAVTLLAPTPRPCGSVPSYGSAGLTTRFLLAEVHVAPEDAARARFDAGLSPASQGARALWRSGATHLRELLRATGPPTALTSAAPGVAAELEQAAARRDDLEEPEVRDVLARAVVARILSGDPVTTRGTLERLQALGGPPAARAALDALAWRHGSPAFVSAQLGDGLASLNLEPGTRRLALDAALEVAPDLAARVLRCKAELLGDERWQEALVTLQAAHARGAEDVDLSIGKLLVRSAEAAAAFADAAAAARGYAEALPHLRQAAASRPEDFDAHWILSYALEKAGFVEQAVEPAIVAFVLGIDRAATKSEADSRLVRLATLTWTRAPGWSAAALQVRRTLSGTVDELPPWPPELGGDARQRNLFAWALGRRPVGGDVTELASYVLAQDAAGRSLPLGKDLAGVANAAKADPLVTLLRSIDPRVHKRKRAR